MGAASIIHAAVILVVFNGFIEPAMFLTGHVCRRQKEMVYRVTTNRAFLCNERYTTSCGHLDWRRCTKYRVQTCYTPSERYAARYREVEECCPGWQEAAGTCSIPACHGRCQNGGVCSETLAIPSCSCLPGFHGEFCQFSQDQGTRSEDSLVPAWLVPVVVLSAVCGAVLLLITGFYLYKKSSRGQGPRGTPPTAVPTVSHNVAARTSPSPSAPSYEGNSQEQ